MGEGFSRLNEGDIRRRLNEEHLQRLPTCSKDVLKLVCVDGLEGLTASQRLGETSDFNGHDVPPPTTAG